MIAGASIRRRCYQVMGEMFTFELSIRKSHQLVTTGPYSVVRHPSYSSGAMALFGALACHTVPGSWFFDECSALLSISWIRIIIGGGYVLASVLAVAVVAPRLDKEDAMLKREFGSEWDVWAARVSYRLVPGIY